MCVMKFCAHQQHIKVLYSTQRFLDKVAYKANECNFKMKKGKKKGITKIEKKKINGASADEKNLKGITEKHIPAPPIPIATWFVLRLFRDVARRMRIHTF